MPRKPALLVALLCSPISIAFAQRIAPFPAFATHDVYGVAWVDGELLAGSPTYAARFDPGAVEITAALGRTAPRIFPLRVSLSSVSRGDHELLAAAAPAPAPSLHGDSVRYHHGRGVVERYDVRADGIKQSVVFATRPAGSGDLVVSYAVATDMECEPAERADELLFRASHLGGITVGAVTGIDARGRRVRGHMSFDGERLELALPHAFVETASYPLELDPLFGPQLNTGVSFADGAPDVAYDESSDIWGIAFEFPASATTSAVWIMRHDAVTGTRLGGTAVSTGGGNQGRPAIASVNGADRFLIVWQDDSAGNGDIRCRAVRATDGAMSLPVTIAGTPATELAPDVGGDAFDGPDLEALVVWEETGAGIQAVQVTVPVNTGDPFVTGSVVTLDPGPQSTNPTISKSGGSDPGTGGRYVVAWEATIGGTVLIGFLGVDRDLNVLAAPSFTTGGAMPGDPDVDGDGTRFLLVFETLEGVAPGPSDVWCQPLEFCSGGTMLCGVPSGPVANVQGDDERQPAVACLGPMFAVAWSDRNPLSTTDYRIHVTNVVPGTTQLCNAPAVTGVASGYLCANPGLCAKRSAGADSTEALLSFEEANNTSGNSLLRSHRYRPFTGGTVTPVNGTSGCGTGGTAGTDGPFAVGNPDFLLTLSGADPTAAVAFLLFDTIQGPISTCGPCAWINPQIVAPLIPVGAGEAEVALPLPCDAGFLGFTMDVQWLVLTPGSVSPPCPLFPYASASGAIRLVMAN